MTRVAYLKRIVAGARRMWPKTEAMVPPTSLPWSPGMSDARSCRKRKNQTLLVSKECEMAYNRCNHIFLRKYSEYIHVVDKHLPSTVATLQDAWWMEDERQRQRSQSIVKSECYVKAGQTGLKPRTEPATTGPRWKVSRDL